MRVLVACEMSGTVRDAFLERGHDAWSADLIDAPGPHIQGDVSPLLLEPWDLVIAHPPCTYLSQVQHHLLKGDRLDRMHEAVQFFRRCLEANAPRVCVENPTMATLARVQLGPCTQAFQPWEFGDNQQKRVCLWLRGLPPLFPTRTYCGPLERVMNRSSKERKDLAKRRRETRMLRSIFFPGVAAAMAEQWT